jgi:hypothetical protein
MNTIYLNMEVGLALRTDLVMWGVRSELTMPSGAMLIDTQWMRVAGSGAPLDPGHRNSRAHGMWGGTLL